MILFGICCIVCFAAVAQTYLTERAKISLLTTSPSDDAVYTLYGHTSIRIRDSIDANTTFDYIFNYGMFDQSVPNFLYKFVKGETDYMLGCYSYSAFESDRLLLNSNVCEQVLNLYPQEIQTILTELMIKSIPENRNYRYNFFFDNCATRPAILVEEFINGNIIYEENLPKITFRDMINHCTRDHPWVTFGCDLALGSPTDRIVTIKESFFIPEYLKNAWSTAKVENFNGTERSLVLTEHILIENVSDEVSGKTIFTPLVCGLLLFVVILLITWVEWKRKKYFRIVDCLLFFFAGMAGCVMFFLCFISVHPSIWPNINIVWLHPFHLAAVALFAIKKLNKAAYWYHFTNFVALLLMLFAWIFIPQHLNMAFIPLIATFLLRSGYCLIRNK